MNVTMVANDSTARTRRAASPWEWAVLLVVASIVCLNNLGGYRPLTTHEVLVAQSAREMLDADDWLVPRFFGEVRLKKPPLAYWEAMVSYSVTGAQTEWSARLPSALAGIALILMVASLARRHYGRRTGLLTGLVMATSVFLLLQARLAEVDITLALLVAVAMDCYDRLWRQTSSSNRFHRPLRLRAIGFWLACGLTVLAKGPVGILLLGPTVVVHALVTRRLAALRALCTPVGVAAGLLVAFSWPLAIVCWRPEAVEIWITETIARFIRDPNDVVRHRFYYPWVAVWMTLPWAPCWIAWVFKSLLHRLHSEEPVRGRAVLLVCWLLIPMFVLSLSAGKQEHYLIPALAPCCIWSALALRNLERRLRYVYTSVLPIVQPGKRRVLFLLPGITVVAAIVVLQWTLLPQLHGRRLAAEWARSRTSAVDPELPLILLGHSVQWLSFYVPRATRRVDSIETLIAGRTERSEWVLTTRGTLEELRKHRRVINVHRAPADSRVSTRKTPVLVRLAGKADESWHAQ